MNSLITRNRRSLIPFEDQDTSPDVRHENDINLDVDESLRLEAMVVNSMETGEDTLHSGSSFEHVPTNDNHNICDQTSSQEEDLTDSNNSNLSTPTNSDSSSLPPQQLSHRLTFRSYFSPRYTPTETDDQDDNISAESTNMTSESEENQVSNDQEQILRNQSNDSSNENHPGASIFMRILLILLLNFWIVAVREGNFGLSVSYLMTLLWISSFIRRQQTESRLNNDFNSFMTREEQILSNMGIHEEAQLSRAIWESRMLAMMGGIADPIDDQNEGVSEGDQLKWKQFEFLSSDHSNEGGSSREYVLKPILKETILHDDSCRLNDTKATELVNDDATCSICLGDYEHEDKVIQLPCSHMYHADCIKSWTKNHVRCPLCNIDLTINQKIEQSV